jgi:hypothetical protein
MMDNLKVNQLLDRLIAVTEELSQGRFGQYTMTFSN